MALRVLRKRLFMIVYTKGLYITDALAISSGTSASPGESKWSPLKILIRLTRQYGDQLSIKAATATAVRRANFICHCLRRCLMRLFSGKAS